MYTNTTRITGLSGSGIDTDTMIQKLMNAESSKLYRYQKSATWKTWQQEAYRNVITKFKDFQTKWLGVGSATNLRYSSAFSSYKNSVKTSSGSESSAVTINKSSASASYKIGVKQLAEKYTYVGDVIGAEKVNPGETQFGREIKTTADVDGIIDKINNDDSGISLTFTLDGKSKTINLTKKDFASGATIDANSLQDKLNEKLKSAFGSEKGNQAKVQVSITGDAENNFKVKTILGHEVSVGQGEASKEATKSTSINVNANKSFKGSFDVTYNGKTYIVTLEEDSTGKLSLADRINNALSKARENGSTETANLTSVVSASADSKGNLQITNTSGQNVSLSYFGEDLSAISSTAIDLKTQNDFANYFNNTNSPSATNKISGTTSLEDILDKSVWSRRTITEEDGTTKSVVLGDITINGKTISFTKDTNLSTFIEKINSSDAGVKLSYNSTTQRFTLASAEEGEVNEITFGDDSSTKATLKSLGFAGSDGTVYKDADHYSAGKDAILTIDGVETTRTSNTIDLQGMNITLNSVTDADNDGEISESETLTIGNEVDVDGIYDTLSKFVEEYNTLIGDLNKQVKEKRAKADDYSYYEPLTDQQKKEMDEDEIKLWEEKAKTGLVYRDSAISTVLSKMRSALYSSLTKVDGTKISLYNLGITTSSDFTEQGKLVIDEEKLKASIKENPEDIISIFTGSGTNGKGLADQIDDIIDSAIGTKGSLREKAGIVGTASVDQNTLSKQIKELNDKISKEKERLVEKENKYYSLFSSMESSVMNSNSQLDALLSMVSS